MAQPPLDMNTGSMNLSPYGSNHSASLQDPNQFFSSSTQQSTSSNYNPYATSNSNNSMAMDLSDHQQRIQPRDLAPSQRRDSSSTSRPSALSAGPYARPPVSEASSLQSTSNLPAVVSNTNSEFTKRKNWSQHIIDEIQDFMHVLAPNGNLMFSTPSIRELTGWTPEEVIGKPISDFIHADDIEGFTRDFQNSLRDGNDLTLYYRFRMKDDRYIIFEITGHPYYAEENGLQRCKCFFAMGRPYPSKNTAMLDSFLELKIENERLRQELNGMYNEMDEQGDYENESSEYGYGNAYSASSQRGQSPQYSHQPAVAKKASSSSVYRPQGSTSSYGGAPQMASAIMKGADHSHNADKKKKKARVEEGDFVCRDCGTIDSPEWRKGPDGPKSLCNACGLRYAKLKNKGDKEKPAKEVKQK